MNRLKMYLNKETIIKSLLFLARIVLIGVIVGTLVTIFQFTASFIITNLKDVFIEHNKTKTIIFLCILPFIIFSACYLTNRNKNIRGGGIPQLENNIHKNKDKLNWKKDLPMMFISSLLTFSTFSTLGAEGPSVVIGGNSALMVNDFFKEKDDDSILISAGAAYGCALQSPISGICYIFEEMMHTKSVKNIIKAIIIVAVSYAIISNVFPHKLVFFQITNYFKFEDYYFALPCMALIVIFNFAAANLFLGLIMKMKEYLKNNPESFYAKYGNVIYLIISVILAFVFGNYMSSGSLILNNIDLELPVRTIIFFILFRIILTVFGSTSKVSGGIVIPQFAIGFLIGCLIVVLVSGVAPQINIIKYASEIILLSMLSFYVVVMETPITGISLIFAFTSFESAKVILLPTIIVMFASTFISKLNKYGNLYDILKRYL